MRILNYLRFAIACLALCTMAAASEYHGQVTFGGLPLPGAQVTATQGDNKLVAVTDQQGIFSFPDLKDGNWTIEVEMQCFNTIRQDVVVGPNTQAPVWELKLLPLDQIKGQTTTVVAANPTLPKVTSEQQGKPESKPPATAPPQKEDDLNQSASDGFLINGSMNNGAASPFAQLAAFGNARSAGQGVYHGGIGVRLDNAALDARPFSLSGLNTPKASYNRVTTVATFGGPLKIPHLFQHGPIFFVSYQWTRDRNDTNQSGLVPDLAERQGDFSHELNPQGQPVQIFNPATGLPFAGNVVPVSQQARALLNLYPLPNVVGNPRFNFQTPIISNTHQDALQSRMNKTVGKKDQLYGGFAFESTRTDNPNLFSFLDKADAFGINGSINWSHRFTQRLAINIGYRFSRLATRITPFWQDRANISGQAGITGNNQDPMNWGPPSLNFSSGIAGLSDQQSSSDRNQTNAFTYSFSWNHNRHNFTFGGDFRRQEFNYLSQQDPRGALTFTGAATQGQSNGGTVGGSDLADFLLGTPDTSAIAFGNADKYFRESVYSAYVTDDWRVNPQFSINVGMRWEYGAPITELFGRLVNLDVAPGFTAVAPVVANNPVGPLTGQTYPSSLINPDKHIFEPRIGIAWRPISGSSLVVRAGYGIYSDTSVYQNLALQMAQQAPLSKSLSVQNSAACPLTLANPFNTCSAITPDTFAVSPDFRVGYAQNWQVSLQRDLPGSLQLLASYLGIKGAHGMQEFLPNTFPIGAVNPCPTCPAGFAEVVSNGSSTRESGQLQLRRRLHNGLTGTIQYAFSKSIDNDSALGGQGASAVQNSQQNPFGSGASQGPVAIAQNWLNLGAERGPSTFDQRHLLTGQLQYTTGLGLGGGTLMSGWRGTLLKGWTFLTSITTGSGLPETPIFLAAVPGTGVTGTIRPDLTGAPIHAAPTGLFLNPAAYAAPVPGQWGNAGRDSIVGPNVFSLNGSIGRSFLLDGRYNLDFRVDSTDFLNHPTFTSWNTVINSAQFGLPAAANPMRNMLLTMNMRF
ncbi:MAG TPA: carboxypeptidase regulatory-like domain-containing protein [Candidatus Angelobacter sp.]|nr:carboxypeptidase regulatory-like domain-containing protein [Candidatus Angelobacter sp.]